jgi:hypothetical protein
MIAEETERTEEMEKEDITEKEATEGLEKTSLVNTLRREKISPEEKESLSDGLSWLTSVLLMMVSHLTSRYFILYKGSHRH